MVAHPNVEEARRGSRAFVERGAATVADERLVAAHRASAGREGRTLDLRQLLVVRVADGRWRGAQAAPYDQHAPDAFWA